MAPMVQQRDNLARIRDNQRRSRARRREYVQELEQCLRVYELQGVEASTEVQMAARRVAEENRQLRELLNRHGVADDDIALFLQSGSLEADQNQPFRAGDAGSALQSLHHVMLPRRLDQPMSLLLPEQSSRETSTASGSTASSSIWEPSQPLIAPPYGHQRHMALSPAVMGAAVHAYYPPRTPAGGASAAQHDSLWAPAVAFDAQQPRSHPGHDAAHARRPTAHESAVFAADVSIIDHATLRPSRQRLLTRAAERQTCPGGAASWAVTEVLRPDAMMPRALLDAWPFAGQ